MTHFKKTAHCLHQQGSIGLSYMGINRGDRIKKLKMSGFVE
jgi:hypothetical protein